MTSLAQWLTKIEIGHPTEIDMGLGRVETVAHRLGLSFEHVKVITVAGTNGKGTTCRLMEQICLHSGLSVGVYSSPHILSFNERIRINDLDANDAQICEAFQSIESVKNEKGREISLTYFEYATLAAFYIFAKSKLDVVILEVGLGGRLDATTIVDADINVITSIELDHQDYLGDTLGEIACEKMGIVKKNKCTVVGYDEHFADAQQYLDKQDNAVMRRGIEFSHYQHADGFTATISRHSSATSTSGNAEKPQNYKWRSTAIPAQNVATALAALTFLAETSDFESLPTVLADSIQVQTIIDSCRLAGRVQVLQTAPLVVLDVAHNQAASDYLRTKLESFDYADCHIVVGMLKDKNIEQSLLSFADVKAHWYCASLPAPRGEQYQRLLKAVPRITALSVAGFDSIDSALSSAVKQATNTDMILVFGSFISVAQATSFFNTRSAI